MTNAHTSQAKWSTHGEYTNWLLLVPLDYQAPHLPLSHHLLPFPPPRWLLSSSSPPIYAPSTLTYLPQVGSLGSKETGIGIKLGDSNATMCARDLGTKQPNTHALTRSISYDQVPIELELSMEEGAVYVCLGEGDQRSRRLIALGVTQPLRPAVYLYNSKNFLSDIAIEPL